MSASRGESPDLSLSYVELRTVVESLRHTASVDANDVNGLVEVWIDPPVLGEPVAAVANVRLDPEEARALARSLMAAADLLAPEVALPYACAECGTRTASTFVVTTLDYADEKGTRTETCRACDDALRDLGDVVAGAYAAAASEHAAEVAAEDAEQPVEDRRDPAEAAAGYVLFQQLDNEPHPLALTVGRLCHETFMAGQVCERFADHDPGDHA